MTKHDKKQNLSCWPGRYKQTEEKKKLGGGILKFSWGLCQTFSIFYAIW